jgi:glycosyltransferase involved in cell wall biosynthesis
MPFLLFAPFKIRRLIKKIKPDIVHAHYVTQYGFCGAFSGFHPLVVSAWGSDIATFPEKSKIHRFLVRYVLRRTDLFHVQDPLSKKRVEELGAKDNKIKVIPWGVDLTKFSIDKKSEKWRKKLQKLPGPIIIIIRDVEKRFADALANVIGIVTKNIPEVNFVIVKSNELKNKIKSNKNVQFIDWIPYSELPLYLANSDIFIDPYYPERPDEIGHTYGMALLEAMASGVPTLVAERPTVTMLQGNDKWYFGSTYERDNPDDLAEKIFKLLENKKEQGEIKEKNIEILNDKFDCMVNMGEIEKLYKMLDEKRCGIRI